MRYGKHAGGRRAAFAELGETRLVHARRRQRPSDPWSKSELECPMSGATTRRLTAVSRYPRKRDGFTHYPGARGHAAEGVMTRDHELRLPYWPRQHQSSPGEEGGPRWTSDGADAAKFLELETGGQWRRLKIPTARREPTCCTLYYPPRHRLSLWEWAMGEGRC
jgi:hypothetical protein